MQGLDRWIMALSLAAAAIWLGAVALRWAIGGRQGLGLSDALNAAIVLGAMLSALLLAYFYLRLDAPEWPAAGLAAPELGPFAIGIALLAGALVAIRVALLRIRADDHVGQLVGIAAAVALVVAAGWVQWGHLLSLGVSWTETAYGSVLHTLSGFSMAVTAMGLIMAVMTFVWAVLGHHTPRRHVALVNTALAFTLWNFSLRQLSALESSAINNTMLIQIALLAWLFLDESLGWSEGAGILLVSAGIILAQASLGRRRSP